jgi:hypothetical protein
MLFLLLVLPIVFAVSTVSITSPAVGATFTSGQVLVVAVVGSNSVGQPLPPANVTITISFRAVVLLTVPGALGTTFNVGQIADDVRSSAEFITIQAVAIDDVGSNLNTQMTLAPQLCNISFSLSAGVAPVNIDFQGTRLLPLDLFALVSASIPVSVTSPQNGLNFLSWSDGGLASHNFVVPPIAATSLSVAFALATTTQQQTTTTQQTTQQTTQPITTQQTTTQQTTTQQTTTQQTTTQQTTTQQTTTPAAPLPPGCVLRPSTPGVVYQRLQITLEQDYMTTSCSSFLTKLANDMQLTNTAQLFLVGVHQVRTL